jgi:iron complex outermembrane receptor protein
MLKSFFGTCLLLLSLQVAAQQFSLTGSVRDSRGTALGGASVQVGNTNYIAVTDDFGRFSFTKLEGGDYTVTVRFIGFHTHSSQVSITANTSVDVKLEQSTQMTDEVIVYATRANDKTPTTFTNVSSQALQKQNFGQDMPLLLNWTPSLVTTSDAGAGIGYTGLRIRGSDASRINVTINGIPYNDSESQGTFWVNIPDIASSTQSVQVQRGVGTSTNGAGSFGGSVNVQTISLQRDAYAEMITGAGSFNSYRYTVKAGTGLINNRWSFDGRVSKITSDGYIDRASSNLNSFYLSGGYYKDKTVVKVIAFGGGERTYQSWNGNDAETIKTNRTFNSAGALYDTNWNVIGYYKDEVDDYKQNHYQSHLTQQLSENWNANASLHYTYGRGFYEQYKQAKPFAELGLDDITIGDSTLTYGDFVVRKWLDNHFYGGTFSFNYEKEKVLLTLGGAYNEYANAKHFGEIIWSQSIYNSGPGHQYYDGESKKKDFNVYTKVNYDLTPKLNVFIDLQYRKVDYLTSGISDDQFAYEAEDHLNFFNPKAGITYSVSDDHVFYASYAVAHREPNRTDYVDGDEKPKPERLDNTEIGWRITKPTLSLEANYYLMNYKDQLVLTGELNDVGSPIRANVGKSFRTGVEISGVIQIAKKLTWNANVTFSVNRNKDYVLDLDDLSNTKNTPITLSPGWIAGSQLAWPAFRNFQATLLSKYVGKQFLDNTGNDDLALASYLTNDFKVSYSISLKEVKAIELSFMVNNLFNVKYSSNGYNYAGTPYYYPQAGINFMSMIALKI